MLWWSNPLDRAESAKHNDVAVRNHYEMRVMIKGVLKQKHTRAVRISLIGTMGPSRTQITALLFCCVCEAAWLAKQNSCSQALNAFHFRKGRRAYISGARGGPAGHTGCELSSSLPNASGL